MGSALIQEAAKKGFEITGAIASTNSPEKGKTLHELGLCNSNIRVADPTELREATENSDVYVSFTSPEAEMRNIPEVANIGKRIVMGTTGFTEDQMDQLKAVVSQKVPAVFAPNFAVGVNLLFKIVKTLGMLPRDYDVSIVEAHHSGKKDAPSGTAQTLAKIVSESRGYEKTIYGRSGISIRRPEEIEVVALRAGGIPGKHEIIAAGPYEMLTIEHLSFSRSVFAQGALYATEWITRQTKPGVYSLDDVLAAN
jgi:4-hydroxy-tetrahydrodipicolinate reductase